MFFLLNDFLCKRRDLVVKIVYKFIYKEFLAANIVVSAALNHSKVVFIVFV